MKISLIGLFTKPLSYIVPIKHKLWIFGSDTGNMYREGSKYLLEYMLKYHPDYHCVFITNNEVVKHQLDRQGIPCEMNFTLRGIWTILRSEVIFTTQTATDIKLIYKKQKRSFYYLGHGQPYKRVYLSSNPDYTKRIYPQRHGLKKIWHKIAIYLTTGYNHYDSKFYTSTSEYLVKYNKMYFGEHADVRILGMPRNDGLFHDDRMKCEKWIKGLEGKLIITYMPTHRDFGKGALSPIPFTNNVKFQQWLKQNNVVLLIKQHPNMEFKVTNMGDSDTIIDISKEKFDPQVVLYHSDALITDFSSVWIDYLMLNRPLLFYIYDNYEQKDTGKLYDIREDPPGHFCYTEEELFELIKRVKTNYETMKPSERIIRKYHKYLDDKSCERYFNAIVNNEYAEG